VTHGDVWYEGIIQSLGNILGTMMLLVYDGDGSLKLNTNTQCILGLLIVLEFGESFGANYSTLVSIVKTDVCLRHL
jgi:hypothetical protein